MKKSKITERDVAMGFARAWNTLDPSHFIKYLNPLTEHNSQWVFDAIRGRERIAEYLTGKMRVVKEIVASGGKASAELCSKTSGPFVFSSTKSPRALADARRMEEKLNPTMDSFGVYLTQEMLNGEKVEILVDFEVENGLLIKYCLCMPGLFRYRRLGIIPGTE